MSETLHDVVMRAWRWDRVSNSGGTAAYSVIRDYFDSHFKELNAAVVANCPRMCQDFCNEHQTQKALAEAERKLAEAERERDRYKQLFELRNDTMRDTWTKLEAAEARLRAMRGALEKLVGAVDAFSVKMLDRGMLISPDLAEACNEGVAAMKDSSHDR